MVLVGKDSELVCTLLTCPMTAELARILVVLLQFLITDYALMLIRWVKVDRSFKRKNRICELEADLLFVPDMNLVSVPH